MKHVGTSADIMIELNFQQGLGYVIMVTVDTGAYQSEWIYWESFWSINLPLRALLIIPLNSLNTVYLTSNDCGFGFKYKLETWRLTVHKVWGLWPDGNHLVLLIHLP